ncbi:hypothetical protein HDU91_001561 [Kappamyces sp. JEL0680]|nr:hypothetical protein HDU91_001561 [Kappamyces sp. JEL0680]
MSMDLDWCLCGKRCALGSLYCSSTCYISELHPTKDAVQHDPIAYPSPTLSIASSLPPSPLVLAATPAQEPPMMMLGSFRNRPHHHHKDHASPLLQPHHSLLATSPSLSKGKFTL